VTSNRETQPVLDYLDAVFNRARVPLPPAGFEPDWSDRASRHRVYPGAERLPLPPVPHRLDAAVGELGISRPYRVADVATLLQLSCGLLGRRLDVNGNQDVTARASYPSAVWSRGAASGGGMYPVEVFWASGPSGTLLPGVYHYSTAEHALRRVLTGDVTAQIRGAVSLPVADRTDQFLLAAVRFWKNSFKYNSFCYHVVAQDVGALLGTWGLIGRAQGVELPRLLWFDDEPLNRLLGLDLDGVGVFAVVPLPGGATRGTAGGSRVVRTSIERSRRVIRFPLVEQVHRASLVDGEPRPDPAGAPAATPVPLEPARRLPLPEPVPLPASLGDALVRRRSAFGAFHSGAGIPAAALSTVLASAAAGRSYRCDVKADDVPLTRLHVLVNRVPGIDPGAYAYDGTLSAVGPGVGDMGAFLQRSYQLSNYAMRDVSAVVAISGRPAAAISVWGNRGYRILSAEVGAVAQTVYVAAAALGVACGAVLGLDNVALDAALGLGAGSDEKTMLFVLLGEPKAAQAGLDQRLF